MKYLKMNISDVIDVLDSLYRRILDQKDYCVACIILECILKVGEFNRKDD